MSVLTSRINQLSGKFGSISNYQSLALEGFLNESFNESINGVDYKTNMSYSITPTEYGCDLTTHCDQSLDPQGNIDGSVYQLDFSTLDWDQVRINTPDGSQSVRDYVYDLNHSNNMYDLMTALSSKFSDTATMSLSDYKNICDQYAENSPDVKEFEKISLLSFGTSVNRASFLNLISSFFRQAMHVQSDNISVPNTRVYVLNSLLNLIDMSTLWTAITFAVMMISKVAGAIVAIIVAVLSAFSSLLHKAASLVNIDINTEEDNGFWNAPVLILTDVDLSNHRYLPVDVDIAEDTVIEYKLVGLNFYLFGPSWDHANVVCYIDNVIDPVKFGQFIINHSKLYSAVRPAGDHTYTEYFPVLHLVDFDLWSILNTDFYYDPFEWYAYKDKYPMSSLYATLGFTLLTLMGGLTPQLKYMGIPGRTWSTMYEVYAWLSRIDFNVTNNDPIVSLCFTALQTLITGINLWSQEHSGSTALDFWDIEYMLKAHSRTDYVFDVWDNLNRNPNNDSSTNKLFQIDAISNSPFLVYLSDTPMDDSTFANFPASNMQTYNYDISTSPLFVRQSSPLGQYIAKEDIYYNDDMNVSTDLYNVTIKDSYPLHYEFETPKAANSTLSKALLTLAAASAIFIAAMVAYKVAKIKLTNRFRESSAHKLASAKKDYEDGNITLKQYRKFARRYNWKASMLGLPTYDYMNSWYNVDSASVTDTAASISASLGTASEAEDVELSTEQPTISTMIDSTMTAIDNNDSLLRRVLTLIKGTDEDNNA